jgi:SAM-dependent methyltransferase
MSVAFTDETSERWTTDTASLGNAREYYFGAAYRDYNLQNPPPKIAYYGRLMRAAVGARKEPRILDVGCAFGRMLRDLPENWHRYGVDSSEYALSVARSEVPGATFVRCELPPRELGKFDLITAFDVIEHIADLEPMLERIDQMLVPGGTFLFVVPVYDGPLGWLVRALDFDVSHVNKWSRAAWLARAEQRFDIVGWRGIYRYLFPGKFVHIPTKALRNSAPAIVVSVKKRD